MRATCLALFAVGLGVMVFQSTEADAQELGTHQSHWQLTLGARHAFLKDAGYDPYSEDDVLSHSSLGVGRTLLVDGSWSVVGAAYWEYGSSESQARGNRTELDVHRMILAPEGRFHLFPRLYGFGRVGPSLLHSKVSLEDASTYSRLSDGGVSFGFDAALGLAYEVLGRDLSSSRAPRGWLSLEGGYTYAGARDIELTPVGEDQAGAPQRLEPLDFPSLSIKGAAVRLALSVSF